MNEELLNKIKLIDNDLTASIIKEVDCFFEGNLISKEHSLVLNSFNIKKIKKYIIEIEDKEGDKFLLLNLTESNKDLDKINIEQTIEDFSNIDLNDYTETKIYRVILTNHSLLNENLNLLLGETVVLFEDETLDLDVL